MATNNKIPIFSDETCNTSPNMSPGITFENKNANVQISPKTIDEIIWTLTSRDIKNSVNMSIPEYEFMINLQEAVMFINKMGIALSLRNVCIVTAVVIIYHFYIIHSFKSFPWNAVASAAILIAIKLEDIPYSTHYITGVSNYFVLHSEYSTQKNHELLEIDRVDEIKDIVLSGIGCDVVTLNRDIPPRLVVSLCRQLEVSGKTEQISYLLASCVVFCTTFIIHYDPKVIACFALYQAFKWTDWKVNNQDSGIEWYQGTVDQQTLENMNVEFRKQYKRCPKQLKQKFVIITRLINEEIFHSILHLFYPETITENTESHIEEENKKTPESEEIKSESTTENKEEKAQNSVESKSFQEEQLDKKSKKHASLDSNKKNNTENKKQTGKSNRCKNKNKNKKH